jgi:hypothetical protein
MSTFAYLSSGRFAAATCDPARPFGLAGIAWDGSVTNRPGARFGPRAIREASSMLCDAHHPHFDTQLAGQLCDWGDLPLPNTSLERMREALAPRLAELIRGQHMVFLGGDHSITLPILRAYTATGRAAAGADPFRRPLRHLDRPLRRTQRPRHLGLRGDPRRAWCAPTAACSSASAAAASAPRASTSPTRAG